MWEGNLDFGANSLRLKKKPRRTSVINAKPNALPTEIRPPRLMPILFTNSPKKKPCIVYIIMCVRIKKDIFGHIIIPSD